MLLAHAVRSLRRAPAYAAAVIVTLTLGLACLGSMFTLLQGVLLAPLPYPDPDRLVRIELHMADGATLGLSPAIHATARRFATRLEDVALYRRGSANVRSSRDEHGAEHLAATWATASLMRVLRSRPLLGRGFSDEEEHRGGPDAVILSESEWRMRYGAAPEVIGTTLIVNDVAREIVGVMPAQFAFPDATTRLWLPAKSSDDASAGDFFYAGVARLSRGADIGSAQHELDTVLSRMAESFPRLRAGGSTRAWLEEAAPRLRLQSLHAAITGGIAPTLWMFAGIAGLTLLVAWANVANLFLLRADSGRQQVAVREALGATPLRAYARFLGEAVVTGAIAAVLASLATFAAIGALRAFAPIELPRLAELVVGPGTLAVIVLAALLGTVLTAALVIAFGRSPRLSIRLQDGARTQSAGRARHRLRATVTVVQIAAALVVLAGSAVLLRTAQRLQDVQPGFDSESVMSFRILLPFARYDETARVAFHAQLTERVAGLPSVQAAGLTARLPLGSGFSPAQDFRIESEARTHSLPVNVVGNGFFDAMGMPLAAGRDFRALTAQRADELVISRGAARTLFADVRGTASLGRRLRLDPGGPTYTVIGVVGDARYDDLATPPTPMLYRPQVVAAVRDVDPGPLPGMILVVRSTAPPQALVRAVRDLVHELDPTVPVFEVSSMQEIVRQSMARVTLTFRVLAAASAITLVLGMIGLYGVVAYLVALRLREFGLRIALGADPARIARWVIGRGLMLAAVGLVVGLAVVIPAVPVLRASIPGIAPWDPVPIAASALLLFMVAALACAVPARRAAKVDPAQSLRSE